MAHINLENDLPGIRGPMAFRPETARPLNELAEILLHSNNSLPPGERELIGAYVSYLNDCFFLPAGTWCYRGTLYAMWPEFY